MFLSQFPYNRLFYSFIFSVRKSQDLNHRGQIIPGEVKIKGSESTLNCIVFVVLTLYTHGSGPMKTNQSGMPVNTSLVKLRENIPTLDVLVNLFGWLNVTDDRPK